MKKLLIYLALCLFTGCSAGIGGLVVTKKAKEAELAALQAKHQTELVVQVKATEKAKDAVIEGKDKQITAGSNAFYAADLTFDKILTPTRTDYIINNYVNEGWTALGKKNPDAETIMRINERLKKDLDEKATSMAQLKADHDAKVIEAQKIADESKARKDALDKMQKELATAKEEKTNLEIQKRDELNAVNNQLIALQKEKLDNKAEIAATKAKFIAVIGSIALLCVAGAIWSPVFKKEFGIAAGVLGFICVGILYIQGWHLALVAGIAFVGVCGWAAFKYFIEHKAATNTYRGLQEIKTKNKEKFDEIIKPVLTEWNTVTDRYGKTLPDRQAENHIDNRLREAGDK